MKDKDFLLWLADRLVEVYGESPNVDFVLKLRAIASTLPDHDTDILAEDSLVQTIIAYRWSDRKIGEKFLVPGDDYERLRSRVWASYCNWRRRRSRGPERYTYKIQTRWLADKGLEVERIA